MNYTPHPYQQRATEMIVDRPFCGLFLEMGLGKTVATLTAIRELEEDYLEVNKCLVIAPLSVAINTWTSEASKWSHTANMRVAKVMGTAKAREKALEEDADIYVTNRDNLVWLVQHYTHETWPFDMVVLDESSSFKNSRAKRFKAMKAVRPLIRRLVLLTGTPSPNGLMDLWAQVYLLDMGKRLGRTLTDYRYRYFIPGARNGQVIYNWNAKAGAKEEISRRLSDICVSMKAEDYLTLPAEVDGGMTLEMSVPEMKAYKQFERDMLMEVDGEDIVATTAQSLMTKLQQFAGGSIYDKEHDWHTIGNTKMDALCDIIEAADSPVVVYYGYRHELERMKTALAEYEPVNFTGDPDTLRRWNAGEIRVLLCHPASVAYGLNMQQGGHIIVWYSLTWSLELYQQANARLLRQGQTKPVIIYRLVCKGTADEMVKRALTSKTSIQDALMERLKEVKEEPQ